VYLIGAQSLTMDEFQTVVVRAALGALHPRVRSITRPTERAPSTTHG
jgi:hypothetical protein